MAQNVPSTSFPSAPSAQKGKSWHCLSQGWSSTLKLLRADTLGAGLRSGPELSGAGWPWAPQSPTNTHTHTRCVRPSAKGTRDMFPEKEEISTRSLRGNCPISVETQPPRKNVVYSPSLPPLLPSYLWKALPRSTSFRDNAVQINCHSGIRFECRQSSDELHMAQGIGSPPSCTTYPVILVLVSDILGKTW